MALRLTSCSPRRTALLPPSLRGNLHANLTPAPRRQDHTTSPYAIATLVSRDISVHRISPHVRDDREPPLVTGETGGVMPLIWVRTKAEYFSAKGWTDFGLICPSGQLVAGCRRKTRLCARQISSWHVMNCSDDTLSRGRFARPGYGARIGDRGRIAAYRQASRTIRPADRLPADRTILVAPAGDHPRTALRLNETCASRAPVLEHGMDETRLQPPDSRLPLRDPSHGREKLTAPDARR